MEKADFTFPDVPPFFREDAANELRTVRPLKRPG